MSPPILEDVPLAPLTTLQLGGPAARLATAETEEELAELLEDARERREDALVLGGGSNLVVADEGFPGTVVRVGLRGVEVKDDGTRVVLDVAAGEEWDALALRAATEGWAGVEAMAGIPGKVGATPIQNVGAYGQEVRETIAEVRAYDRARAAFVDLSNAACAFAYRSSRFKGDARFAVTRVRFVLEKRSDAEPRYPELSRALGLREGERAPLTRIRETVIALRRTKGMVLDPSDPESVSAGSFFVNPIVSEAEASAVRARSEGLAVPMFPGGEGRVKLSAGWLVEHAGFPRGFGEGRVGVSRKHALALVHRGGGTTKELLALARTIQAGVYARFGVELVPEPVMVGCTF